MTVLEWPLDAATWSEARQGVIAHGGVMVPAPEPLPLFETVTVVLKLEGTERARIEGQVVQHASGQAALMLEDTAKQALLNLNFGDAASGPGRGGDEPLSKADKIKMARLGPVDVRRRILRDSDQTLHPYLLTNPGLTAQEVVGWFRSKLVPKRLIEQIAKQPKLAGNLQVMEALVYDPRTPIPIALKLVPKIPLEIARRIAKQGNLRTQIVSAARKRVIS
ncbi:MAG: hypothetical protein AAFZ18_14140 [Myxococcota bacterium]